VLLSPSSLQVAQGIRPEDMFNVYTSLNRIYDYIVIDAGSALNENAVTLLDVADRALVITNPDLAALHDISRFIQLTWSLSYPPEKVLVVLNRVGMPGGIRSADVTSALRQSVFAQIPDEGPRGLRSINSGVPLINRYPRSGAARAFKHLAQELLKLTSTAPSPRGAPSPEADAARRDALLASSQFG
jgi:pilus assembly protein CpaE